MLLFIASFAAELLLLASSEARVLRATRKQTPPLKRRPTANRLEHLPQDVRQDASVAVIVDFLGRVGARDGLEHCLFALFIAGANFDGHSRREF